MDVLQKKKRTKALYWLLTPIMLGIILPFVINSLLPEQGWQICLRNNDVKLTKAFPEVYEKGSIDEQTLFKFGDTTYFIGLQPNFIREYIMLIIVASVILAFLGNIFAFLLYRRSSRKDN